jgi:hypothetical protein
MIAQASAREQLTSDEIRTIVADGYVYAYPLVLMAITRGVMTNTEVAEPARFLAPVNQFCHALAFPDAYSFSGSRRVPTGRATGCRRRGRAPSA